MTKIALFGATGRTGSRVLERLLQGGHGVRALVREPSKLTQTSALLEIVQGDVLDAVAVSETVAGCDAVVCVLGHVKGSPPTLQADGTRNVVDAMRAHRVDRIVSLSGGGLSSPHDRPRLPDRAIRGLLKATAGHVLADAQRHLGLLEASGLKWTVVRAPRLSERPGRGQYRVGWVGVNASTQISRDDLADFIVTQVDDSRFVGEMPFVSA